LLAFYLFYDKIWLVKAEIIEIEGEKIMKPIIGLTTFGEYKARAVYNSLNSTYINAIVEGGGAPLLIPMVEDRGVLAKYMNVIDGIIFTGGEDISPLYYGENPIKELGGTDESRDSYEMALFMEAYRINMPILGICRGCQLINVALGGSLYQDVNSQIEGSLGHSSKGDDISQAHHMIRIEKDSKLYDIFGNETIAVNSFHHQAIKKMGDGLKATAYSYDGIIEAIESVKKDYIIGVQWHPEAMLPKRVIFAKLFEEFVKQCASWK